MKFDDQSIDWAIEIGFEYLDSKSLAQGEVLKYFIVLYSCPLKFSKKPLFVLSFICTFLFVALPRFCFYIVNLDVAP